MKEFYCIINSFYNYGMWQCQGKYRDFYREFSDEAGTVKIIDTADLTQDILERG